MKKILSVLLAVLFIISAIPAGSLSALSNVDFSFLAVKASASNGVCGYNMEWDFDSATGELILSGSSYMYDYYNEEDVPWYSVRENIKKIIIGEDIVSLGRLAFAGCTSLTEVIFPESLCYIGAECFSGCTSLESVSLPANITSLFEGQFVNCSSLNDVSFNSAITWINVDAFVGTALYADPDNWDNGLFYIDELLIGIDEDLVPENVTVRAGTEVVADSVFEYCETIKSVAFPDSIRVIGDAAFSECSSLETVRFNGGNITFYSYAFDYCKALRNVYVPNEASWLSMEFGTDTSNPLCFGGKLYVNDVLCETFTVPENVTEIGMYAFENCSSIKNVVLSSTVTKIADYAFEKMTNLETVSFSDVLETIGNAAFYNCLSLKSLDLPASLQEICGETFYCCISLESITVDPDNPNYASVDDVLFNKDVTQLILCPAGKSGDYTVPDTVKYISSSSFMGCYNLNNVYMTSVEEIEAYAFQAASNLAIYILLGMDPPEEIKGLNGVYIDSEDVSIADSAFAYCTELETVSLKGVSYIGMQAFLGCNSDFFCAMLEMGVTGTGSGLKNIYIEGDGFSIDYNAFSYCPSLETVELKGVSYIAENAFAYCSSKALFDEIGIEFGADSGLNKLTITGSGATIGERAFASCFELSDITLSGINNIDREAFDKTAYALDEDNWEDDALYIGDCFILADNSVEGDYVIKDGTKVIADYAFYDCENLDSVTLPDSVNYFGTYSFNSDVNCYCSSAIIEDLRSVLYENDLNVLHKNKIETEVSPATCTEKGKKQVYCEDCLEVSYEDIEPVGHTFGGNDVVVEPTCSEKGYTIRYCTECNTGVIDEDSYTEHERSHEIENGKCRYCGMPAADCVESEHDYPCGTQSQNYIGEWTLSKPGARTMEILFSSYTEVENNKDFIYIYDGSGNLVGTYTGKELSYRTVKVPGEEAVIRLVSDGSGTAYGFSVDKITVDYVNIPVNGSNKYSAVTEDGCPESDHDYSTNSDKKWQISDKGAEYLEISFNEDTFVESGYDFIIIYDKDKNEVGSYTGAELSGKTVTVEGDEATIRLTSDYSNCYFGFAVDSVTAYFTGGYVDHDAKTINTNVRHADDISDIVRFESGITAALSADDDSDCCGTGTIVTLFSNGEVIGDYTLIVEGDLDGDGCCSVLDVFDAERIASNNRTPTNLQISAATNGEGDQIDDTVYQNLVNIALGE